MVSWTILYRFASPAAKYPSNDFDSISKWITVSSRTTGIIDPFYHRPFLHVMEIRNIVSSHTMMPERSFSLQPFKFSHFNVLVSFPWRGTLRLFIRVKISAIKLTFARYFMILIPQVGHGHIPPENHWFVLIVRRSWLNLALVKARGFRSENLPSIFISQVITKKRKMRCFKSRLVI